MTWTPEKLAQVPEVYRDFMTVLKPVLDSRKPGVVLRINGIPFGMIYEALSTRHGYGVAQVRQLARNLCERGWIDEDSLGFFTPTGPGEELIHALSGVGGEVEQGVPPLPIF